MAGGLVLLLLLAGRIYAQFTESINWDEFALFQRAYVTWSTGNLVGGGRPGLGTLLLVPFAAACNNAITSIVQARFIWTLMTVAAVASLWALLTAAVPSSRYRRLAVITGVGLWCLAPPFLRYSIQVRTDQPAILLGLLGGVALLASRRQPALALVSGVAWAIGFLFSQKLIYVALLCGTLAIGRLFMDRDFQPRRDLLRAVLLSTAFFVVLTGYDALMSRVGSGVALLPVTGGLSVFEYYRRDYGWVLYRQLLPVLVPQLFVLALLAAATVISLRRRMPDKSRQLATAWGVATAGGAVITFHAARFPYFYMVLGLFIAAIAALLMPVLLERMSPGGRKVLLSAVWVPLAFLAATQALLSMLDRQAVQRESLTFVDRNFPADARGFQPQGAFICRADPDPFPVRFRQNVVSEFRGPDAAERSARFIDEFRGRPVAFMIHPGSYNDVIDEFWATRYVPYAAAVSVPGRRIVEPGTEFEPIVSGHYVWHSPNADLRIDGALVRPGERVPLTAGRVYRLDVRPGEDGMLALALREPPSPQESSFFSWW